MFPDCVRCAAGSFTAEGLSTGAHQPSTADVHLAWSHRAHDQQLSGAFCKPESRVLVFCRAAGFQDNLRSKLSDSRMFTDCMFQVRPMMRDSIVCFFSVSRVAVRKSPGPYDML